MELTIFNEKDNSTIHIQFNGQIVAELLQFLRINPEAVLVARNSEILLEDEQLHDKDNIELLSVVSGG